MIRREGWLSCPTEKTAVLGQNNDKTIFPIILRTKRNVWNKKPKMKILIILMKIGSFHKFIAFIALHLLPSTPEDCPLEI